MKLAGLVEEGAEAKAVIQDGKGFGERGDGHQERTKAF